MNQREAKRLAAEIKLLAERLYEHAPLDPESRPKRSREWGRGGKRNYAEVKARGATLTSFVMERGQIEKAKAAVASGAFRSQAEFINASIDAYSPLTEDEQKNVAVILALGGWPVTSREAVGYALANTARLLIEDQKLKAGTIGMAATNEGSEQRNATKGEQNDG
jgi:Arc/MetJ-type ribon-helix-helix transcriptional regulator